MERRTRSIVVVVAALALSALSLACGLSGQAVPACQSAPDSTECSACCSREGFTGHLYSSFDETPCKCM